MNVLLFVYGTLKRGCSNQHHLMGQRFVGPARTPRGYRLYDLGGYPAMIAKLDDEDGVVGEVWLVDPEGLKHLDEFEGVHEGLYRREVVPLVAPFAEHTVEAYLSALPVVGRPDIGSEWTERRR